MRQLQLTEKAMSTVIDLLRAGLSVDGAAKQLSISETGLRNALIRAGKYEEFRNRKTVNQPAAIKVRWDEAISNKYLIMKLRHYA